MLTRVTAKSQYAGVSDLVLNVINRPETDLFEVRNIDGLGAVKANVNTTPLGSVDGESYIGSNVGKRNIVFTLGLDPDWETWTPFTLRRLLDKYFMPKLAVDLIFETQEFAPVHILGYVESNDPNMFSKDPEQQISIICPEPEFVAVDPIVITGTTADDPVLIDYNGTIETGINLVLPSGSAYNNVTVSRGESPSPNPLHFSVDSDTYIVNVSQHFEMNSIRSKKYVQSIENVSGDIVNLLSKVTESSLWPLLGPGITPFQVRIDVPEGPPVSDWTLTYYEKFGSL